MPTTAETAMNTTGCSFFVGLTTLVSTHSATARMTALIDTRSVSFPVTAYSSVLSSAMPTTDTPAAAISPVEAGRRP